MVFRKQVLLTQPIKRFLIQCVAKSGPEPELLMNELELCKKFNVSRITAHRAVADLLKIGYLIQLPKRRGVFSNPAYSHAVPYSVGIIGTSGSCVYVDSYATVVLGAFLYELKKISCMTTFVTLDSSPEHAVEEIYNIGTDGIFWMGPEDFYVPAIDRMIDEGYPVVATTPAWSDFVRAKSNYVGVDYEYSGFARGQYFVNRNCRRVLFCGASPSMFRGFGEALKPHGLFEPELRIMDSEEAEKVLPALLDAGTIDGIFCEWENSLHFTVLNILKDHPDGRKVKLLLSNGLDESELRRKYPGLQIHCLHSGMDQELFMKIGKRAAQKMMGMLQNGHRTFEPEVFRWKLDF